jgi:hypothetical protein
MVFLDLGAERGVTRQHRPRGLLEDGLGKPAHAQDQRQQLLEDRVDRSHREGMYSLRPGEGDAPVAGRWRSCEG